LDDNKILEIEEKLKRDKNKSVSKNKPINNEPENIEI